jgi:hypothetical protein
MRISATQLESYRLWRDPEQEWMTEDALLDSIKGVWVPNHKVSLGSAFGKVLEDPDRYLAPGGFRIKQDGEIFEFSRDVIEPCLAVIDRRGVFEAKAVKAYGPHDVASKADHLLGADLSEFKTTLSTFDFDKYANSCQWRFMADAFQPRRITYHVFCLSEAMNDVIELRSIETFRLYPYPGLSGDCAGLVEAFADYVTARGLDGVLKARQEAA